MNHGLIRKIAEFAYNSDDKQVSDMAAIVLQQPSLYQGFKVKRMPNKQDIIHWIDEQTEILETEIFFDEDEDEGFVVDNQEFKLGMIEGKKEMRLQLRRMLVAE